MSVSKTNIKAGDSVLVSLDFRTDLNINMPVPPM